MNFVEKRKGQMNIKSANDELKKELAPLNIPKLLVQGPELIDCNKRRWQKGDSIGIIASSGVGKTSFLLWCFKHILINNPEGICVFIACEMSKNQLLTKWKKATQDNPEIGNRFYIITTHDDDGNLRDLSIRGIKKILLQHKKVLNEEILAYSIDHLHIVRREENESLDNVVFNFTMMNRELNTIGFMTSQTTKSRSGGGELPLDKDACYGCSSFTWELSYIYTLCIPLQRIQDKVDLPITGWNLAKNRFKEKDDTHKVGVNYLLRFNYDDESYRKLSNDELLQFTEYYDEVVKLREDEDKKSKYLFDTSYKVNSKTGKQVTINRQAGATKSGWD